MDRDSPLGQDGLTDGAPAVDRGSHDGRIGSGDREIIRRCGPLRRLARHSRFPIRVIIQGPPSDDMGEIALGYDVTPESAEYCFCSLGKKNQNRIENIVGIGITPDISQRAQALNPAIYPLRELLVRTKRIGNLILPTGLILRGGTGDAKEATGRHGGL